MRRVVESAKLTVEEVVRYQWGPFDSEQAAVQHEMDANHAMTFQQDLVLCHTSALGDFALVKREAGEWWWVATSCRWEHRPATADDRVLL